MKTIQSLSRKQAGLIGGAVFVLAMLVIVPWQVVAQEAKQTAVPAGADGGGDAVPANAPPAEPGAKDKLANAASKQNDGAGKLLVGTWRGGPSGSDVLTIQKDGTYTWLFRTDNQGGTNWQNANPYAGAAGPHQRGGQGIMMGRPGGAPYGFPGVRATYTNNSGHWKLDGNAFTLIYQPIPLAMHGFIDIQPGMGTPQATDLWPTEFEASGNAYTAQLSIVRVDDSVLRMTGLAPAAGGSPGMIAPTGPKFFKRVDNQSATPTFAADVPKDQQHVAQLACLNADEAKAMTKWIVAAVAYLKNNNQDPDLHLGLLDRIQSARAGKSDFAELFQLTDDEAKAYRDLNKLAGGFGAVCTLGNQGQLTATELSALKKIVKFKERLDAIGNFLAMYVRDPFQDNSPMMGAAAPLAIGYGTPADAAGAALAGEVPIDGAAPAAGAPPTSNIAERQARVEMLYKLQTLFIELDTWIDSTVFN